MEHAKISRSKIGHMVACIASVSILVAAIVHLSAFMTEDLEVSETSSVVANQNCKRAAVQLSSAMDSALTITDPVEPSTSLEDAELMPSNPISSVENIEPEINSVESLCNTVYSEDVELLAKLIYLEAGTCSEDCQWLVGSTAVNLAEDRGGLEAVAYDYSTFNVAYQIDSCSPSEMSYAVASRILSGDRDYQVYAFRTDMYHEWATPYISIDNVYFSTY